ncbi:MAG TPA: ribbon-helix-helix domain-containing protein [Burkholderiales bacterium]
MRVGRRELMPLYLRPEQKTALEKLSKATGKPQQVLAREGIDLLLAEYGTRTKKQRKAGR